MNIVHVIPAFTKGGGEKVALDLANHAAAAGHKVTMVAGLEVDPTLLLDRLRPDVAVRYVARPGAGRALRYGRLLPWLVRNRRWLAAQDVVHCHMSFGALFGTLAYLLRRAMRGRTPAIVETNHSVGMPIPSRQRAAWAKLYLLRDAVAMMAEDPYWDAFRAAHPELPTRLILNGIPVPREVGPEESAAYRRGVGVPEGCLVAGTIGALRPERLTHRFVAVFEGIAERLGPDVHFFIGGEGRDRPRVEAAIAASPIHDRIHMAGLVQEPAVALSILDLYLTLNVGPVTGIAALEAASAGLPVLAIQLRDDYETPPDAWIWSSGDADALAAQAAALLGDAARRSKLAARQSAHVRSVHSVEAMAERYEALYSDALAAAAAGKSHQKR